MVEQIIVLFLRLDILFRGIAFQMAIDQLLAHCSLALVLLRQVLDNLGLPNAVIKEESFDLFRKPLD